GSQKPQTRGCAARRPAVESLEDRCVPSIVAPPIQSVQLVEAHAPAAPVQVLTFTDTADLVGNSGNFTVKIDWKDGSPVDETSGSVVLQSADSGGSKFAVLATHTYSHSGSFPVTVILHDIHD